MKRTGYPRGRPGNYMLNSQALENTPNIVRNSRTIFLDKLEGVMYNGFVNESRYQRQENKMLTPEMLEIVTSNSDRLRYPLVRVIDTLRLMPGCTTTNGREYVEGTHPQMAGGIQRNLTGIICGTEFAIGDSVHITAEAHARQSSPASLLSVEDTGTITHIRWPNSENLKTLVIQVDFAGRNYHLNARDLARA